MKNIFALVFAITCTTGLSAQSLKELKNKVKGTSATTEQTSTTTSTPATGGNQYVMAEAFFNAGSNYAHCRFTRDAGDPYQESTKLPRDDFFREIKKDANNQIIEFGNSLGNGSFKPNEVAFPMYYFASGGGLTPYIYFIDGFAICTKDAFSAPEQLDKVGCNSWEIYCNDKSKLKSLDSDKVKAMLKAHVGAAKQGVDAVRAEEKAAAEKLEAEKRAKYTTQGKAVTKIRVEVATKTLQQGKSYTYTVIATLKDGSEISTANGGYIDEFIVSATGLPATYTNFSGTMNTLVGSSITVPDEEAISGDKVVLTVKSKFHPTLSVTQSFDMVYNENITLDYNGDIDPYGRPRNGGDFRIEIKAVTHAVTGEKLLEYRIFSKTTGDKLKHFRISQTSSVNFQANGKNGKAANVGPATNGTNGGNITVVIDPSVKSYTLNITNSAGRGGAGDSKHPVSGSPGTAGTTEKLNQKVNW